MKPYINRLFHFYILLFLFVSCSPNAGDNVAGENSPLKDYNLIEAEIRSISEDTLQRYNPYYFHPNYKPSLPLLISEPDVTKAILSKDSLGYDIRLSVQNDEGSTPLRGAIFSSAQIKN